MWPLCLVLVCTSLTSWTWEWNISNTWVEWKTDRMSDFYKICICKVNSMFLQYQWNLQKQDVAGTSTKSAFIWADSQGEPGESSEEGLCCHIFIKWAECSLKNTREVLQGGFKEQNFTWMFLRMQGTKLWSETHKEAKRLESQQSCFLKPPTLKPSVTMPEWNPEILSLKSSAPFENQEC